MVFSNQDASIFYTVIKENTLKLYLGYSKLKSGMFYINIPGTGEEFSLKS